MPRPGDAFPRIREACLRRLQKSLHVACALEAAQAAFAASHKGRP